ncbi:hypothetical protein [Paraburkholderia sp. BL10I2N1]|uniref:hypothetical protein n=1 Tax=Paraburkholderia sp. BL10I2N1 TaxID=1938796 RepID=UPI00141521EE|nr:hypothetical protein [Paraburkholderia sp. BL10I2N1]
MFNEMFGMLERLAALLAAVLISRHRSSLLNPISAVDVCDGSRMLHASNLPGLHQRM